MNKIKSHQVVHGFFFLCTILGLILRVVLK